MGSELVRATGEGLYCAAGDFHIDPWKNAGGVSRAIITHGHADHARAGMGSYLAARPSAPILRHRLGGGARIEGIGFGERVRHGDALVSLHPAGHILGSAQVRIEHARTGEVWVVTGDYKRCPPGHAPDPTSEAFEPVRCHTLITEGTFALPIYRWPDPASVFEAINAWWRGCQSEGKTALLYGYSLGKAQRLLTGVDASIGPILVHGAVAALCEVYRAQGIALPAYEHASVEHAKRDRGRALVIAPPSAGASEWVRKFGAVSDAFASGWMLVRGMRRRRSVDRGFVLSDHADWPGLLATIEESGAERVGATHGSVGPLVEYLRGRGVDAFVVDTRFEGEDGDPGERAGERGTALAMEGE